MVVNFVDDEDELLNFLHDIYDVLVNVDDEKMMQVLVKLVLMEIYSPVNKFHYLKVMFFVYEFSDVMVHYYLNEDFLYEVFLLNLLYWDFLLVDFDDDYD